MKQEVKSKRGKIIGFNSVFLAIGFTVGVRYIYDIISGKSEWYLFGFIDSIMMVILALGIPYLFFVSVTISLQGLRVSHYRKPQFGKGKIKLQAVSTGKRGWSCKCAVQDQH